MLMLIKRNFLLYFRNRGGVFLSLLGAMISFILYLIFLKDNIKADWSQVPYTNQLLDSWLMSGTLAIAGLTTTLSSLSQLAQDRENKVDQDLFITDLGSWGLHFSYLISSAVIGFFMQIILFLLMLSYFIWSDKISFDWNIAPQILLIMALNALMAAFLNALVIHFIKSVDNIGKLATIVGAASGFFVGTYIPIATLPTFAQTLIKFTPSAYLASLFRQVLMKEAIADGFADNSRQAHHFEEVMGVRLKWDELLTMKETYYIVVVVLAAAVLIWLLQHLVINHKTKKIISSR